MRQLLRDLQEFRVAHRRWRVDHPGAAKIKHQLRHFRRWRLLRQGLTNPLMDQQPWLTFAAGDFLRRTLSAKARVFEWGMGGSSLFFARNCREVISVEDDAGWFRTCQTQFAQQRMENWTGFLAEADSTSDNGPFAPSDWRSYRSSGADLRQKDYRQYVGVIDRFEDSSFDLVVVDGRARPACIRHAVAKIRAGGWLVLDNSDRDTYQPTLRRLSSPCWSRSDFPGPGPYVSQFWATSVWQRTSAPLDVWVDHAA